jgi:hypothetical protein
VELTHIAGPPAQQQVLHDRLGGAHLSLLEFRGRQRQEVTDQRRDLVAAFRSGRMPSRITFRR